MKKAEREVVFSCGHAKNEVIYYDLCEVGAEGLDYLIEKKIKELGEEVCLSCRESGITDTSLVEGDHSPHRRMKDADAGTLPNLREGSKKNEPLGYRRGRGRT